MQEYLNKITQGDNLPLLQSLPDNCVKLCITSPPFGIGKNNIYEKGKEAKYLKRQDDIFKDYFGFIQPRLDEMIRVSEYVFFNIQMLSANKVDVIKLLYEFKDYYKDVIIWAKNSPQPAMERGVLNSGFEFIYIFSKDRPDKRKFYDVDWRGTVPNIINFGTNSRNKYSKLHKAQFPANLPKFIIENFSKEQDVILDCFSGLGTVALEAKKLNRQFVGFELEQAYVDISNQRLAELDGVTNA